MRELVRVHVWLPDTQHVGHTALTIGTVYVSFWPEGGATKKDIKIKRSHPGSFVQALQEDIANEGRRQPTTIELRGLNEDRILDFVNDLIQRRPRYQLARHNCSHVVANCLLAGTEKRPSFTPHAGQYTKIGRYALGIWTPDQVLKFARELKAHEDSVSA